MADIKVGVRLICLRTPGPEGLETAAQIGADSVQLTVGRGEEYAPEGITAAGIRELQQRVQDLGMVISATDGGLGDFGDAETVAERVARTKHLLDHTRDLGAPALTSHIGIVPKDASAPRRQVFHEAMEQIGKYAEQIGTYFGIETGPEPAPVLLDLIESIDTSGIKINLDPANFIVWWARIAKDEGRPYDRAQAFAEADPHEAVYTLRDHIIHTHIKDARIDDSTAGAMRRRWAKAGSSGRATSSRTRTSDSRATTASSARPVKIASRKPATPLPSCVGLHSSWISSCVEWTCSRPYWYWAALPG